MSKLKKILECLSESAISYLDEESQPFSSASEEEIEAGAGQTLPSCCMTPDAPPRSHDRTITMAPRRNMANTYNVQPPQGTYIRDPINYGGATFNASEREYPDMGPWRQIDVPEHVEYRNIPAGAHRSYPPMQRRTPAKQTSAYEDTQNMLDLKEVLEHRRKAPRFYSTPVSDSFHGGPGIDESTLWGQNLSSFDPTDSEHGWSKGVRMASFNVIRQMSRSPRRIQVPPRLMQTYPPPQSPRQVDPTQTQYSKVLFPESTQGSCPTFTKPNETFARAPNATFTPQPVGWRPQVTYTQPPAVGGATLGKTFRASPRMRTPQPSRNYLTYDENQPMVDVRRFGEDESGPKFYSTPIGENIPQNVPAQMGSRRVPPRLDQTYPTQARNATFSCPGALCEEVANTPATCLTYTSPTEDVPCVGANATYQRTQAPPQLNTTYSARAPPPLNTTYSARAPPQNRTFTQPGPSRGLNTTYPATKPPPRQLNETCTVSPARYGGLNTTHTVNRSPPRPLNETYPTSPQSQPLACGDLSVFETPKRSKKKFSTVLEVRTPDCTEDSNHPVHLSINVSCADPSLLLTPDRRFNIISNTSAPGTMMCVTPGDNAEPPCDECATTLPPPTAEEESNDCCPCPQQTKSPK